MSNPAYTKEELLELCKNSFSYNEILAKTGRTKSGSNREVLKKYINLYQIDISHFTSSTSPKKKNRIIQDKKICLQCQQEKDAIQDFYWSKGHTRNICKECVRLNEREKYLKNKQKIIEYKSTLSCKKCGENRFYLLDFHHLNPEEKEYNISDKVRVSVENMQQELEKCDVLCSNCHREWHYLFNNNLITNYEEWLNK